MNIFITDKTIEKLESLINNVKCGSISARKAKSTDKSDNIIKDINLKLTEKQRKKYDDESTFSLYISKKLLTDVKKQLGESKEGGIIPFLPLIFGGLAALGGLATGTAAVTKVVLDNNRADAELEENKRHNIETEKAISGSGIKDFVNTLELNSDDKETVKKILKSFKTIMKIEKSGKGVYLGPI
jgi:hypothetical protein